MASNKKKKKLRYGSPQQIRPQAMTEQQMRIQKMRDELNAPDPNDPHVFTRYKGRIRLMCCFLRMPCIGSGVKNPSSTRPRRSFRAPCAY